MKNGNADDFIYYLYDADACVRYKSYVDRFSKLRYNESNDKEDCINHLTEDILWDGKSFYELEKALTWFDWE